MLWSLLHWIFHLEINRFDQVIIQLIHRKGVVTVANPNSSKPIWCTLASEVLSTQYGNWNSLFGPRLTRMCCFVIILCSIEVAQQAGKMSFSNTREGKSTFSIVARWFNCNKTIPRASISVKQAAKFILNKLATANVYKFAYCDFTLLRCLPWLFSSELLSSSGVAHSTAKELAVLVLTMLTKENLWMGLGILFKKKRIFIASTLIRWKQYDKTCCFLKQI